MLEKSKFWLNQVFQKPKKILSIFWSVFSKPFSKNAITTLSHEEETMHEIQKNLKSDYFKKTQSISQINKEIDISNTTYKTHDINPISKINSSKSYNSHDKSTKIPQEPTRTTITIQLKDKNSIKKSQENKSIILPTNPNKQNSSNQKSR